MILSMVVENTSLDSETWIQILELLNKFLNFLSTGSLPIKCEL